MRLDQFVTPEALAFTVEGWSRPEIETAIERLIDVLDGSDAHLADREPETKTATGRRAPNVDYPPRPASDATRPLARKCRKPAPTRFCTVLNSRGSAMFSPRSAITCNATSRVVRVCPVSRRQTNSVGEVG